MKKHVLVFGCLISAALMSHANANESTQGNLEDLLNPAYMAAALCGRAGQQHGALFKIPEATTALNWKFWQRNNPAPADGPPLWDNLGDYTYPI